MKKKLTYLSDDGTCYVCYDFYIHNNMRTSTNAKNRYM